MFAAGSQDKLNEAMLELTKSLGVRGHAFQVLSVWTRLNYRALRYIQEINAHNEQTATVAEMWSYYMRNVKFNLEADGTLVPPK